MGMVKKEEQDMNKTIRILASAVLLGSAILTGCNKNGIDANMGQAIRFSAVSQGAPSTKTTYGEDSGNYQIIDWKANDLIRVYSDNAVHRNDSDQHFADYIITGSTISGHESRASLAEKTLDNTASDNTENRANGLIWGQADTYKFWGIYPSTAQNAKITLGAAGAVSAELLPETKPTQTSTKYADANGKVVAAAVTGGYTYTVYEPDMNYAYMTAIASEVKDGQNFNLVFNPAFTAFEINLTSADDEEDGFTVMDLSLMAAEGNTTDFLAGPFTMTAGNLTTGVAARSGASQSVKVTLPGNGKAITQSEGLTVTLFAIPKENTAALTLLVNTDKGPARLVLNDKATNSFYKFKAGTKYRINLLKIGGRFTYAITLEPMVLPWIGVEEQSSFSENIQAKAFSFVSGALEETDAWKNSEGLRLNRLAGKDRPGSNHYEAFDTAASSYWGYEEFMGKEEEEKADYLSQHKTYYELYYQQRHMIVTGEDPHFVITFTPMAPLAGYWLLKPESVGEFGGMEGFQFKIMDGENWQTTGWNQGQIMGTPVTIGIWPAPGSDPTKEYAMIVKAVFTTNKSGEPAYNADTEMQDVHGDGRYSYWKFILPPRE